MAPPSSCTAITRPRPPIVDCLPPDMITEIVARVAATSAIDLFRCKQTCKIIHEIADEKRVLQQVALEELYTCTWRNQDKAQSFFDKCRNSNNPEAVYRLGMVQYFSRLMPVEGLKNLEKAATQMHKEAIYALALILMCIRDEECTGKGADLLFDLMRVIEGKGIVECRRNLRDLMHTLQWVRVRLLDSDANNTTTSDVGSFVIGNPNINCINGDLHEIENNWEKYYYYYDIVEDNVVCKACKCGREASFFCDLVNSV